MNARMSVLAGIASAALLATPAAADFRDRAGPAFNWSGCYIGVHGGGGVVSSSWNEGLFGGFLEMMLLGGLSGNGAKWGGGFLAGGQVGCNYQVNSLVIGVEGEGWWSNLESKQTLAIEEGGDTFGITTAAKNRWDAAVSLRVGFTPFDTALIYAKVGAAWGGFDFSMTMFDSLDPCVCVMGGSATLPGLLLGAGVEVAFSPNWTAKLEYNYIRFAEADLRIVDGDFPDEALITTVTAEKHIVKVGINYKFGGRR